MGYVNRHNDLQEKALFYYKNAYSYYLQDGDKTNIAYALRGIGIVYWSLGEKDSSFVTLKKALTIAEGVNDGDLKAEGGTVELANLSWTYDSAADTYFKFDSSEYEKGYQIGSSKKPQTTAWHFTATLPEGSIVKGYKINAATAKDGVSSMTINVGEYSKKHTLAFESADYIDYAMNTTADKFDIVMQAESKAMYLKSFTIYVD